MKILGLGHYSRTGKNTLANMIGMELAEKAPELRVKIVSFAAKLKDICYQLYGWDGLQEEAFYDTPDGAPLRDVKLQTLGMTPVEIWVAMGTPAIRENVYQNTWIDFVLRRNNSCDVMIVTDVRFLNEVQAIRDLDGVLIKCVREGMGPRDTVADLALLDFEGWDFIAGPTLVDLSDQAKELAWMLRYGYDIVNYHTPAERSAILSRESPWIGLGEAGCMYNKKALERADFS